MKHFKYISIIIGFVLLVFVIVYYRPKTETVPLPEVPVGETGQEMEGATKPMELCFAKFGAPDKNSFYDRYTLRLVLDGEKVTGELNFLPAEKDSKVGEFEGTTGAVDPKMMARKADLWWYSFGEGISVKEELKIIFGEGTASIGFGEMKDRGDGVYVYKDSTKISYNLELTDVACLDLAERVRVEEYLQENIITLSPTKPVLGGTWYVVSTVVSPGNNSGVVTYEDGHIEEKRNFTYTLDSGGEVQNLIIK
ncbi:MAG: hypothetical protein AAB815_00225 [Patescibacteria group bacterium]